MIIISLIFIAIGFLLLWQGAFFLIKSATQIAKNFDISPLFIAITIIALGTTLPELFVSLTAALQNNGEIVLGNIIGSNILNITFILGISGLIMSIKVKEAEKKGLQKEMIFFILAPILLWLLALDKILSRADGLILILSFLIFNFITIKNIRESRLRRMLEDVAEAAVRSKNKRYAKYILILAASLIGLILGARLTVSGALKIAEIAKIPPIIISLTIIAIGTSLPELFTSIASAIKKADNIRLGNILGSNVINILFSLGLAVVIAPLKISSAIFMFDLPILIFFTLFLTICFLKYKSLNRLTAVMLLVMYVSYILYRSVTEIL